LVDAIVKISKLPQKIEAKEIGLRAALDIKKNAKDIIALL